MTAYSLKCTPPSLTVTQVVANIRLMMVTKLKTITCGTQKMPIENGMIQM